MAERQVRHEDVEACVGALEWRRRRRRRGVVVKPVRDAVDPRAEPERRLGRGAREGPPLPLSPRPRPRRGPQRRRVHGHPKSPRAAPAPALAAAARWRGRRRGRRRPPHPDGGEPRPALPPLRHQSAHACFGDEMSSRVGCVTSGSGLVVSSAQRLLWRRHYGELVYASRHRGGEEASPVGSTPVEPIRWTAAQVRDLGHRVSGVASMDGEQTPRSGGCLGRKQAET
jgi:hypothetical protein